MRIYKDSVKHRRYYQLTSGILESEIDELGFYQSLTKRQVNWILFRVRDV